MSPPSPGRLTTASSSLSARFRRSRRRNRKSPPILPLNSVSLRTGRLLSMSGLPSGKPQQTPLYASAGQTGNDGGTVPASLSQQGFFAADLSIPVTSHSAAISLICTRDGVDTTEILDEGLSVYSHYLIDWQAYGSLNWSRTSGSQTATLSANVQVSCDAPGNNQRCEGHAVSLSK